MDDVTRKRVASLLGAMVFTDAVWDTVSDLEPEDDSQESGAERLRERCQFVAGKMEEAKTALHDIVRLLV